MNQTVRPNEELVCGCLQGQRNSLMFRIAAGPCLSLSFPSPDSVSMFLIGFADAKPARFLLISPIPHSTISEKFLFRKRFNPVLDPSGR